jgi:L-rhamnose isomerase
LEKESNVRVNSSSYETARMLYAEAGVDTGAALDQLAKIPVSMQCWQGDDVAGLERVGASLDGGGIAATGNYPGRPRDGEELRRDLDAAIQHVPGPVRLNLHACYAERGTATADRDAYEERFFARWLDWAATRGIPMDFNPSFFSHPKAADGLTLTHPDKAIRQFWIRHGKACRKIGEAFGRALGSRCTVNVWIPDGSKDTPADRMGPRELLRESLDEIFSEPLDEALVEDAVESKLFGIGSESYVAGSHEFYLGYAITRRKVLCLDSGHFHPTESLADKLSPVLLYVPAVLLHLSRGVRWDSDHVVIFDDATTAVATELARHDLWSRVRIGLDFFDASINRVAAWVIGTRAAKQALLAGLLQPHKELVRLEREGDFTARLALMERLKMLPAGLVWDEFCHRQGCAPEGHWLDEVRSYERATMAARA